METTQLLAQLTSDDEELRAEAIQELTLMMDDDVARAFLDIASSDAGEAIRGDAIIGLGPIVEEAGMDYGFEEFEGIELMPELGPGISRETFETIVREIRALYEDEAQPTLVRRRALEVLVRDPQPWLAPEIRRHFASDDPQWKVTAVFGMGYIGGFESDIAAIVRSEEGPLLYEAVRSAGSRSVTEAADRIRELAASESAETDLRLVAIEALPHVDPDSFEILDALVQSKNEEIAEAAEAALEDLSLIGSAEDFDEDEDEEEEELP